MPNEHMVAELANGAVIVIAHPGQQVPSDPVELRRNFGVLPSMVKPLSASSGAIPAAGAFPTDEQVAAARRVLEDHAVHMGQRMTPEPTVLEVAQPAIDVEAVKAELLAQLREELMTDAGDSPDTAARRGPRNTAKANPSTATGGPVGPGDATPAPVTGTE